MATSSAGNTTSESTSNTAPVSAYWECIDCHAYNQSGRKSCKSCRRLRQDLLNQCLKESKVHDPPNWYCVICSHHNCDNNSATNCAGCGSVFMTNIEYLNFVHEQEKQLLRYQEDSKAFQ
ncbi:unnamed protein product, partial [Adineta steineri]